MADSGTSGYRLDDRDGRVCLVVPGMGDMVHALPIANALKRQKPDRLITWVAEPAPSEVVRHHPAADEIVVFRRNHGLRGLYRLWSDLRAEPAQVTLNLQFHAKSAFPVLLSRAPVRIGFGRDKARDGLHRVHTHRIPAGPWRHTQDLYLDFLDVLGLSRGPVEWGITLSTDERTEQAAFFRALGDRPVAGLILATANPLKDWPPERYAPLAESLERDFGFRVLLLGGPGRREREAAARVMSETGSKPVHALGDSVRRLMWLLDGCDLVISPDTGPLHIAHALEVPVIGLFGRTNPWRVGPYSRYHDLIVDRYTEPDEQDASRYHPRSDRMERIRVEDVVARVVLAADRYGVTKRKRLAENGESTRP